MEESLPPPEQRLTAVKGLIGMLVAAGATIVLAGILGLIFAAAGADLEDRGFLFFGTVAQDAALIGAAVFVTADLGRPSARTFGLRPFERSAFKWIALAFLAYYAFAIVYALIFSPPEEELPKDLGADESVGLAIATGFLLVVIAPVAEEIFFRGLVLNAWLREYGERFAIVGSAALFGAIHADTSSVEALITSVARVLPIFGLGLALAFVYRRTGSLLAAIGLHMGFNALSIAIALAQRLGLMPQF
jgi:hypothetical protein